MNVVLAKIQKLYALESRIKLASVEERWSERQSRAKPLLDDLYDWLTSQKVIESSPLGKTIKYTLGQWPKLIRYVDDGHLLSITTERNAQSNRWSLAEKIGYSRRIRLVLMRVLCCIASSRRRKLTD